MTTRLQKAQHLREVLVPFIQQHGREEEMASSDGTKHRHREATLGRFRLYYETPFHRNPRPEPTNFHRAQYFQEHPYEDYTLRIYSPKVTLLNAYWVAKTGAMRITTFGSRASGWYEEILAALQSQSKTA